MYLCQYCDKSFTTQGNLTHHQQTAKYCLQRQGIDDVKTYPTCSHCQKQYTTTFRLQEHIKSCSVKLEQDREMEVEARISKISEEYEMKHQMLVMMKDQEIALLKQQLEKCEEQLEKRIDDIADIARQTKTKTTQNNILINTPTLDLSNTDHIHSVLEKHLDIEVLAGGQKGLARMLSSVLLTDEQGAKRYRCTDKNRGHFEFVDHQTGILEKDPKGAKLTKALCDSEIRDIAYARGEKWWLREDGSVDLARFDSVSDKVLEVAKLKDDDTKLRTELSVILS